MTELEQPLNPSNPLRTFVYESGSGRPEISISGDVAHRCPFKDEVDRGRIILTYRPMDHLVELESVAVWLDSFAAEVISHEGLVAELGDSFIAVVEPLRLEILTSWENVASLGPRGDTRLEVTVRKEWR